MASRDENFTGFLREGKHRRVGGFSVLQQHQGLPDRFARELTVLLWCSSARLESAKGLSNRPMVNLTRRIL
ncbi:Os03g0749401 [Oryza sativa Japonica Group]|uniref:Os03g0749401 protein n=1 Tax=Oryza sativa subsp. japonica TaxID=39947 RepID=A0A0P0W3N6_ORYSJ|nr:Os03g0749401 [Oryza sativa Japonica Group]